MRLGIDVTTTQDSGLRMSSDEVQFNFAIANGRIMVTHDADFLRLAHEFPDHAGIAYCHKELRSVGEVIRMLRLMYDVLEPVEMRGHIEYL